MMTSQRFNLECRILAAHFPPSRFGFVWDNDPRLEVILPIDDFNAVYKVKIYGMDLFPECEPVVTPGMILVDCNGEEMTEPSRANHLLGEYNDETHMCIYSEWNPNNTLNKTAYRAAMWLVAYHLHLKTKRSIDQYLPHGRA